MATAYIVAATPSSPEPKRIANLRSAKAEADARAKLDRVDVEVHTVATGKLTYTARGAAPAAPATAPAPRPAADDTPATEPATPAEEPAADDTPAAAEDSQTEGAGTIDMSDFAAALAEVVGDAPADDDTPADDDASEPQDDEDDDAPAADDNGGHRGQARCGCSVEKIIKTGEHDPKVCADLAKEREAAKAVERDRPAKAPRRTGGGGGGRRESQGPSVADGWDLLYDKPKQKCQVGRNGEGKYALICTVHKHAHPIPRLVSERGLRGGKRSVWCPECTDSK
ncbi:hypothetical protein [Streptomyces longwoodensis]|uniref:hypothetical protein n=1 Tax=Streptomyces longwoodensis TaxID=68231 RepID=UPI0036FA1B77